MLLRELDALPPGLLDCTADGLHELLGGPTLISLRGAREPALFVSVLLHGNEPSGWNGLRALLAETAELPRSLLVLVGNVAAAARGARALAGQPDYNRIWGPGVTAAPAPEAGMVRTVSAALLGRPLLAAVDLHNNTGHNPYYSVVTNLGAGTLGLAELFSDKAVLLEEPDTVLSRIFTGHCPAVAVELGPVADRACDLRARDFLHRCLVLDAVPAAAPRALQLYRAEARVHVRDVPFSFADEDLATPLVLTAGVEGVNFHELPAGTPFGRAERDVREVLQVLDTGHRDVTERFLTLSAGEIVLRRPVVPAMYTTDPFVIRQDCLCYFMERMPPPR